MAKTRKTISVDPRVWERTRQEAGRLRVSHSWVAETALRKYLRIAEPKARKPRAADAQPPAA